MVILRDRKSALHPVCPPLESMPATEMASAVAIGEIYICLKIEIKDGSQDICKDIESSLRPVTGF